MSVFRIEKWLSVIILTGADHFVIDVPLCLCRALIAAGIFK